MSEKPQTATNPVIVFVLGLLGLITCQILAPIAWIMGNSYMRECGELGIQPDGMGVAGRILGIVGSIIMIISFGLLGVYLCCVFGAVFLSILAEAG